MFLIIIYNIISLLFKHFSFTNILFFIIILFFFSIFSFVFFFSFGFFISPAFFFYFICWIPLQEVCVCVYYVHHCVTCFLHVFFYFTSSLLFPSPHAARYCFSPILFFFYHQLVLLLPQLFFVSPSFASASRTFYESLVFFLGMRMYVCVLAIILFYFPLLVVCRYLFLFFFCPVGCVIEIRRNTKLIVIYYFSLCVPSLQFRTVAPVTSLVYVCLIFCNQHHTRSSLSLSCKFTVFTVYSICIPHTQLVSYIFLQLFR